MNELILQSYDGTSVGNVQFLFLHRSERVHEGLGEVDVALESIRLKILRETSESHATKQDDSGKPVVDNLCEEIVETDLLRPLRKKFVCSFQYGTEIEFERVIAWSHDYGGNVLKLGCKGTEYSHSIEADQLQKLNELHSWRKSLIPENNLVNNSKAKSQML